MIAIKSLTKSFANTTVLNNISFDVAEGEIIAIIGPSGTGKSTLLRCLNYLESPEQGEIQIGDIKVNAENINKKQIHALRQQSSFVFQNFALFANKTALENVLEPLLTVGKEEKVSAQAKARDFLEKVGMLAHKDKYPSQLSGGQQQRVGIARAMASKGKVILFDEPTSALDPEWVEEVLMVIKALAKAKQTMIVVTHEMQFAKEIADRVVFMEGGEIVEQGSARQLFDAPVHQRTKGFLSSLLR